MFQRIRSFLGDEGRKARNIRWLISLVGFLVLAGLAVFLVPWAETIRALRSANLPLTLLALSLTIPYVFLISLSYYIVALRQDARVGYWSLFKINLVMIFYNIILPSTFFVSGLRWYKYNTYSHKPAETLTSIAYLKIFDILLILLISSGLLLFFNINSLKEYALGLATLLAGCVLVLLFSPTISRWLLGQMQKNHPDGYPEGVKKLALGLVTKVLTAISSFQSLGAGKQLLLVIIGITSQLLMMGQYLLIAEAVGIDLDLAQLGVLRASILIVANLPINFSVGIGFRDVTLVSLLVLNGVPLDRSMAMSILVLLINYFYGILGALVEGYGLVKRKLMYRPG